MIKPDFQDLEWLYVPDHEYMDYGDCKRFMQLIIPYRSNWKNGVTYRVILFVPGSAWYPQEMYNNIPKRTELAKLGFALCGELSLHFLLLIDREVLVIQKTPVFQKALMFLGNRGQNEKKSSKKKIILSSMLYQWQAG